ncbi:EF-hand domain-containing protein [Neiella marina]|uniref:EF-hand domain-containing protein n=1 Tax=Neiella holothuriorum TaxID=2870530 RepID=A0ABS7EF12_9GAMM|nr:EF-hand domain-containing protein [Neiella holothuriorum]MBW8190929.1 EF-hand domain-containing protein [Neiella holothuriorum]
MNRLALAIIVGMLAISIAPQVDSRGYGGRQQQPEFIDIDTNNDGFISKEEFETFHSVRQLRRVGQAKLQRNAADSSKIFEQYDLDQDGFISAEEFLARPPCRRST